MFRPSLIFCTIYLKMEKFLFFYFFFKKGLYSSHRLLYAVWFFLLTRHYVAYGILLKRHTLTKGFFDKVPSDDTVSS